MRLRNGRPYCFFLSVKCAEQLFTHYHDEFPIVIFIKFRSMILVVFEFALQHYSTLDYLPLYRGPITIINPWEFKCNNPAQVKHLGQAMYR